MKSLFRRFSLAFTFTLALALQLAAEAVPLTFVYVSDSHSRLDPFGPKTADLKGRLGGIARVATILGQVRATEANVLAFHSGDASVDDPIFNDFLMVPELQLLDGLDFAAFELGNHEFDLGPGALLTSLSSALTTQLSYLCTNCDFTDFSDLDPYIQDSSVKEVGGLKIGIFGLLTPHVPTTNPDPVKILGTDDAELMAIAGAKVQELRDDGADVVVLLSHLGHLYDEAVAENVPGIDVILGGHDHIVISEPISVLNPGGTQTLIVQPGMHYRYVGELRVSVDAGAVTLVDNTIIPIDDAVSAVAEVQGAVDQLKAGVVNRFGDLYDTPIANAKKDIPMTYNPEKAFRDTPMGNLLLKSYLDKTRTEIAITANGLIAEQLWKGPIVGADVFRCVGYGFDPVTRLGFHLATFEISGAEIVKGLELGVVYAGINEDFLLQVAGMKYRYDSTQLPGLRVILKSVKIRGKPVDPLRMYTCTANEGIAMLLPIFDIQVENLQVLPDFEYTVFHDYLQKVKNANAKSQGKIVDAGFKKK